MLSLKFLGAARTVTGSRFLIAYREKRFLVDCGLFQGGKALRQRNWESLPVPPETLDAVVLTHAHIDHSGYLPRLLKEGFQGPVYCTAATADLLSLLLPDSGRLQERDAEYANRKKYSRHRPALPLYTEAEAERVLDALETIPYHRLKPLAEGLEFEYLHAGHILGSAMIRMRCRVGGVSRILFFSGDLGRRFQPIIKDPEWVEEADFLILESTYGDRVHENVDVPAFLEQLILETVKRGGSLIIPAFAIGRSQRVLYLLRELEEAGRIPRLPVYLDSPMAVGAVAMYCSHLEEHDLEMKQLTSQACPLEAGRISLVHSVEESKALNERTEPSIIVSPSGNLAGGRILHHLKRRLPDRRNTVLFVGFQPEGSLGRLILEGIEQVRIHGGGVPVNARIESLNALSAHADSAGILEWLGRFKRPPSRIFLVHGEPAAQEALKEKIPRVHPSQVSIPDHLEEVKLS